jgi:O-antigen ligase
VRKTFSHVITEYGVIALILYLVIFVLVLLGVYSAIKAGWSPKGFAGQTGTWLVAYLITKATTPFRLAATIALAPLVAKGWDRLRGRSAEAKDQKT